MRVQTYDNVLLRVVAEEGRTSIPVVTRMDFGRADSKFTLPIGVAAEIGCNA